MQGAQVQSLVRELDPQVATKSLHATAKDHVCLPLGPGTVNKINIIFKISNCKWTCMIQAHVVQGSTVNTKQDNFQKALGAMRNIRLNISMMGKG